MLAVRVAAAAVALLPTLAFAAPATVEFRSGDPATFRDLRTRPVGLGDAPQLLDHLRMHIERAAPRFLPQDTKLTVNLIDVDMAGEFWPVGGFQGERRIARAVDSPRIELEFRLQAPDGTVLREGRRELTDLAYLSKTPPQRGSALAHEKALITRWLREEFPAPR